MMMMINHCTERRGAVVNAPASYCRCPEDVCQAGYSYFDSLRFSSVPPRKCRQSTLKQITTDSFHTVSNSLLAYHLFSRRYAVLH
jgi:hypothetical protein